MWLVSLLACSEYKLDQARPEPNVGEPDIVVEPSQLTWDTLAVDCQEDQVVTISNVGDATLTLDGTWVEGDPDWSADFLTSTIAPGESLALTVRYAPGRAGESDGQVIISSDDPDEEVVQVPAEGEAASEGLATDLFVQEAAPVDVLWVIDNSGSMSQEQARVASGITTFFSWFTTLNLDYHMGVITTDIVNPIYSGRLVGSPAYIDSTTASPEVELAEAINVGEDDMGNESGLRALELALSEPVLSAENVGFLRPEAHLVVIFLSDEPEQSDYDSTHYIDFLSTVKANPNNILVSAIVGDQTAGCATTCDDTVQDAQPGDKYIEVVNAFDGVFGSICTCDLLPILDEIGMEATRFIRSFPLSEMPTDPSRIAVYVDGFESTDWTYDIETNEIVFGVPPVNGQEVVVHYPTALTCEE